MCESFGPQAEHQACAFHRVVALSYRGSVISGKYCFPQALPDTEAEVLGRLRELEAELRPLAEQKNKIDTRARRWAFPAA